MARNPHTLRTAVPAAGDPSGKYRSGRSCSLNRDRDIYLSLARHFPLARCSTLFRRKADTGACAQGVRTVCGLPGNVLVDANRPLTFRALFERISWPTWVPASLQSAIAVPARLWWERSDDVLPVGGKRRWLGHDMAAGYGADVTCSGRCRITRGLRTSQSFPGEFGPGGENYPYGRILTTRNAGGFSTFFVTSFGQFPRFWPLASCCRPRSRARCECTRPPLHQESG